MSTTHCLFCRIVEGAIPATIVYRDERVTAFRDINPQAPVHVLIIPNRHIDALGTAGTGDRPLLGDLLAAAAAVARQEGIEAGGYRIVVNAGPNAGQSVDHLHLHLLGGRFLAWPPG